MLTIWTDCCFSGNEDQGAEKDIDLIVAIGPVNATVVLAVKGGGPEVVIDGGVGADLTTRVVVKRIEKLGIKIGLQEIAIEIQEIKKMRKERVI